MRADLTVVDRDPFLATPQDLLASRVLMTLVDGVAAFAVGDR